MKKVLPVILVLVLLIAGAAVIAWLPGRVQAEKSILLVREAGTVLYKESEESEYKDMEADELTISSGTFIKTNNDAFARVFLPDNSLISIADNSEVQIIAEDNKFNINQLLGKTWNRVQSVSSGGEYTVETPSTIAAVRGTVFGVTVVDEDKSEVYVTEGDVEVSRFERRENIKEILESIRLGADDHVNVIRDSESFRFERGKVSDELKARFWFLRNRIIDRYYFENVNTNPRLIRQLLTQNLEQDGEREQYLFDRKAGTDEITLSELQEKLGGVIDITRINEQTCTRNTPEDFAKAKDLLNSYSEYVENYGQINDFLSNLADVCADSNLSADEVEQIRSDVAGFN